MKKLCISTILVFFGLVQTGEVLASAKPADISTLGDVTMPLPLHDSQMIGSGCANDSTYTCTPGAPVAINKWSVSPNTTGDSVHTLEESDAYTDANGVAHPASWSPSFVTGADASGMTMTFYNVKPLQGIVIQYGGNQYDTAPPHINELFVVQVVDIKSGATDKSYIVYPFQSAVYQMAGAFKYQDASQIAGLFETYTGRKTSYNTSNHSNPSRTAFFTPEQDVNNGLHDGPQVGGSPISVGRGGGYGSSNELTNYTQNGFFSFAGGSLGYGFMPRMFQSQDPSFTFSMNLGPMPALKSIQVDSYWVMTRQDDPTLTTAPYQSCRGGSINCQTMLVANKSGSYRYNPGAHPVDFFYTFGPTSGSASGYSTPFSTVPAKLDPTAFKIAVSDAPDNPYLGTPAQTVPAGDPSAADGCSTVSVNIPAMYVGLNSGPQTVNAPGDLSGPTYKPVVCTATAYAVSDMAGYTANTAHLAMQYSSAAGIAHCSGCNVNVAASPQPGAASGVDVADYYANYPRDWTFNWTGAITGPTANEPNPDKVCQMTGDLGTSYVPVSGSFTVFNPNRDGSPQDTVYNETLTCSEGQGSYQIKWKVRYKTSGNTWWSSGSATQGAGTNIAPPAVPKPGIDSPVVQE